MQGFGRHRSPSTFTSRRGKTSADRVRKWDSESTGVLVTSVIAGVVVWRQYGGVRP